MQRCVTRWLSKRCWLHGYTRVIYSVGTYTGWNLRLPQFWRVTGRIVDGVLRFHLPIPERPELAYQFADGSLQGTFKGEGRARHGVFSVTKSLGAAVTLLRLAQKYGDQVFDLKIKDYVTVTASHDGWERVTFGDALNMATGIGDNAPQREPNKPFADENQPKMFKFIGVRTAKEKLDISFSYGKYPWSPGEVVRYNSTQTFVLAAALDSFLKRQAGPTTHLWDMVTQEVFQPIGIFHAPRLYTQETDGGRGIPHLLHGLYPTIDDLAKLTTLLQNGGQHQGQQILHAAKLAEALYKTKAMGLPTGGQNRYGEARYHLSFWSAPYHTDSGCFFQLPYMAGYGGNIGRTAG
jgi:hypothetical protein